MCTCVTMCMIMIMITIINSIINISSSSSSSSISSISSCSSSSSSSCSSSRSSRRSFTRGVGLERRNLCWLRPSSGLQKFRSTNESHTEDPNPQRSDLEIHQIAVTKLSCVCVCVFSKSLHLTWMCQLLLLWGLAV